MTVLAPEVMSVAVEHARRGVALQVALRWVLVGFVALTVLAVPPPRYDLACALVAAGYALWAAAVAAATRRAAVVSVAWLALLVDVVVLGVLTLLTGVASPQSWTSDVLTTGFLVIPVLAATQLRPRVCAAVVGPTALVYLLAGVATRTANEEPWSSLLLRTLVMAGVALGCVGLSRIQRSRVRTIERLVGLRTALLGELTGLEQRERRALAEHLHDGALQYVLAARLDLDDARETGDAAAFDRLEEALRESSRLLRSTVADLHPAVLEKAGLPAALRDLAAAASARGGFTATVRAPDWPGTGADALLYRTAGELLANVARHARASSATVTLTRGDGVLRMVVADDGVGAGDVTPGGAGGGVARGVARGTSGGVAGGAAPGSADGVGGGTGGGVGGGAGDGVAGGAAGGVAGGAARGTASGVGGDAARGSADGVGGGTGGGVGGGAAGGTGGGVAGGGVAGGVAGGTGSAARGHIGLASHTVRIEAAGGRLTTAPAEPHGLVVTVELPDVPRSTDSGIVPDIG